MGAHDAPGQIKAESNPGKLLPGHVPTAAELLKDARQVIRVNARAAVDDLDPNVTSAADRAQRNRRAGRGILGSVGQQVAHDLADPNAISPHRYVSCILNGQGVVARQGHGVRSGVTEQSPNWDGAW